jgi:hypothetical protein
MGIKKEENLEVSLMKKMLKIIAMLLVVATVIFAAGCASKNEAKNTSVAGEQQESGNDNAAVGPGNESPSAPAPDLNATPGNGSPSEPSPELNGTPGNDSEGASGSDLNTDDDSGNDSGNSSENETEE